MIGASPRMVLLSSVEAALKRITTANGYATDAGLRITREPAPALADDDAEFIAVLWSRQERASEPALLRTHRQTSFSVIARISARMTEVQSRLDALTGDIEAALADQQFRYPAGYEFPRYQFAEPLLPKQVADGWVGVSVSYTSHIPIRRTAA